jgi:hypothetical protein
MHPRRWCVGGLVLGEVEMFILMEAIMNAYRVKSININAWVHVFVYKYVNGLDKIHYLLSCETH